MTIHVGAEIEDFFFIFAIIRTNKQYNVFCTYANDVNGTITVLIDSSSVFTSFTALFMFAHALVCDIYRF